MRAVSTRGQAPEVAIADAIAAGLAPDGGLYMPTEWPAFDAVGLADDASTADVAARLLAPFFAGGALEAALPSICADAFAVEPPLRDFGKDGDYLLELFHGPTAAFKDYGARFLAGCLAALPRGDRPLTIVVATSGDTGAAVAGAFHGLPGFRVAILYPDGRVSPRQAHQLGCFGDNIRAFRVDGSFDDCQRMAKDVLADAGFRDEVPLGSANSISLGRLFPQAAYYARAALMHHRSTGRALDFVVPTGNLGNALACLLSRRMGLPIGRIVLASNANDVLPDYFSGSDYTPRPSIATLANAMDVGAPSNFERLRWLYPDDEVLRRELAAEAVDDATIRAAILRTRAWRGQIVCPHTACAAEVLDRLRARGEMGDWAAVATAHSAKFPEVVEPVLGEAVPLPPALQTMLDRASTAEPLAGDGMALRERLRMW